MTAGAPAANVIGDFSAVHGLAEAARRALEALVDAGVEVSIVDAASGAPRDQGRLNVGHAELPTGRRHPIDIAMLNINELPGIPAGDLDRYTIGLWVWELLGVDPNYWPNYERVDEIWAGSDFVANTFRALGPKPVRVVPNIIPAFDPEPLDPDVLKWGEGLKVLYSFDANSSIARKNPQGAVEAFRRAFDESERGRSVHLVIKVISTENYPGMEEELAAAVAGVNGTLISQDIPGRQMHALINSCDVYLSPHRSEGFGLGMAEAMSLGKAVVATAYGGNTTFMTPDTACLVGFSMRQITADDHRLQPAYVGVYPPGHWWAEPDIDQAAQWLRLLADEPAFLRELGQRAAAHIPTVIGPAVVGANMRERLLEIEAGLDSGAIRPNGRG